MYLKCRENEKQLQKQSALQLGTKIVNGLNACGILCEKIVETPQDGNIENRII